MDSDWGDTIILADWLAEAKKQGISQDEAISKLAAHMTRPTRCGGLDYDAEGRPIHPRSQERTNG